MGDLKMATARNYASLDSDPTSRRGGVNIQFGDEDELPLAHSTEHRVSEDEQNTDEEMEEDVEENDWSEDTNRMEDVEFQGEVGINVDSENLRSCLDFFLLFFTEEAWQLLVEQTNLYAEQKRGPEESCVWYLVTRDEMKAWVSVYLNMGLVTKANLSSHWSTDPAFNSPFFHCIMYRDRFLQILRYLHFADNTQAPRADSADYNKLYKLQPFLDYQRKFVV